jgi:hypothetical protein
MEYSMHDWTLKKIELDWHAARVTVHLEDSTYTARSLIAEGVQNLQVPRTNEWGPSVSVNEVSEIEPVPSGLQRVKIEMQSGDVIQIVAQRFELPIR